METKFLIKKKAYEWLCEMVELDGDAEQLYILDWMKRNLSGSESDEVITFCFPVGKVFAERAKDLLLAYDVSYHATFTDSHRSEDYEEAYNCHVGFMSAALDKDGEDHFAKFKALEPLLF